MRRGPEIRGSRSSMEDCDADLSPCNFATAHFLQKEAELSPCKFATKEAVLSPCNFATAHLTACISELLSPFNIATHENAGPFRNAPHDGLPSSSLSTRWEQKTGPTEAPKRPLFPIGLLRASNAWVYVIVGLSSEKMNYSLLSLMAGTGLHSLAMLHVPKS